jgi:two-component system, NarL family, sensor histidine kinase LiaS
MQGFTQRVWRALMSLQGKLTLSYVLVTVLTTMVAQVLLLGGIALYTIYSNLIPDLMVSFAGEMARDLRGELRGQATDPKVLEQIYRRRSADDDALILTVEPARDGQVRGDVLVTVLDVRGVVITSSFPISHAVGAPYSAILGEPERAVVQQALIGSTDAARLGTWLRPQNYPVGAYPVFDTGGAVSGVIYIQALFPVSWPTLSDVAFLLGMSALGFTFAAALAGTLFGYLTARPFTRRLARISRASAALAAGDLGQRVPDFSPDEIGELGRQFNQMSSQLEDSMRSLRLMAERNAQLAEQARQLAVVEERNRLARDLHDSVSQQLFSITMLAAAARSLVTSDTPQAEEYLGSLQATAQQALHETRTLIYELRPAMLNSQGLATALREYVQGVRSRERLEVELLIDDERRIPLAHELALFRIAQEALANIARHAEARHVQVQLCHEPGLVRLIIADDGRGFDPSLPRRPGSVGLGSMAERASELSGTLTISSKPGAGTRLLAELPVVTDS